MNVGRASEVENIVAENVGGTIAQLGESDDGGIRDLLEAREAGFDVAVNVESIEGHGRRSGLVATLTSASALPSATTNAKVEDAVGNEV